VAGKRIKRLFWSETKNILQEVRMKLIDHLKKAQDASLLIEAYEKELKKIPQDAVDRIEGLRKHLEELKEIYRQKELEFKKLEGEIEVEIEKIKEKELLLEKGGLKPKEIKALQDDINSRKAHVEALKVSLNEKEKDAASLKEKIDFYEDELKRISERLQNDLSKKQELEAAIKEKQKELDLILSQLPDDVRNLYLTLKSRYEFEVVVPVEIDEENKTIYYCSACSIKLSKSEIDILRRDKKHVHTCPYCGRILYFKG
jgi:predicted  nucleic acid-binding Zn-ribbon protein